MIPCVPELRCLPFHTTVTTVTLQPVISGIQFFAYRVPNTGIAKGATAFFFVV